jgi:hypothetical protein
MPNKEGEQPELLPPEDAAALLTRRLTELENQRGNEGAEQTRQEKASGQPVPPALVLFRRLAGIARDAAGRDEHTRRGFAIVQYACGRAILGELIRQDAELSVLYHRRAGRPGTEPMLASDAQAEVAAALEDQRRGLAATFPTVTEVPLSRPHQRVIAEVIGRVTIRQPQPMETVPLDRTSLRWPRSDGPAPGRGNRDRRGVRPDHPAQSD